MLTSQGLKNFRRQIAEIQRKRRGQTHEVLFFHKVDDPYSYLLLQLVQRLMGDFDIKVKPHIISELNANMFPEPKMLDEWSLKDAKFLAEVFNLKFPDSHSLPEKSLCQRAEKNIISQ
jgi:2-hydroxychromene-2-carboxylate isomerase